MVYYLLAFAIVLVDQFSKFLVVKYMEIGQSIPVLEPVLYLTSHRNRGAAFGILQGQQTLFAAVTVVVVLGIVYYMRQVRHQRLVATAMALILGGAVGNFIDRVTQGEVVDFVAVWIGSYQYPIFNVADSAVVVGVVLLFWDVLFGARVHKSASD